MIQIKNCPECNTQNESESVFCQHCRYPLDVKNLRDFKDEDLLIHLDMLGQVLKTSFFDDPKINQLYHELFSLYWLRPETAVFSFLEARLMNRFRKYLTYPLIDLGCAEGFFMNVSFGASINPRYDAFDAIELDKSDPYNTYEPLPEDFFVKKPDKIGFGVDIKENSVRRALDLKTYDDVKVGDLRNLPFENETVASAYSNMIDDIKSEDLAITFNEIQRILKKEGHLVFTTPVKSFQDHLLYYNKSKLFRKMGNNEKAKQFEEYDRGRSQWAPRTKELWIDLFNETGFEMVEYVKYAPKQVIELWDTGFRTFFPRLVEIKNKFKKNGMIVPVKKIIVEILKSTFHRFTKESGNGNFAMIVAKKK